MNGGAPDLHFRSSEGRKAFEPRTWREQQRQLTARTESPSHILPAGRICCVAAAAFAGAFLGCLATLCLCALGVQPAVASAMATVVLCVFLLLTGTANLLPSVFFASLYGGSFGGMTPIAAVTESVARSGLPVDASFVLLAVFCGVAFCVAAVIDLRMQGLVRDYGGRLGGLAAIASFLFIVLAPRLGADSEFFRVASIEVFDEPGEAPLIYAACAAGMLATLFALRRLPAVSARRADRIFIAATVALIGLALLDQDRPNQRCLLDAFYAGCFLGMSSPKLLKGPYQLSVAALVLTVVLLQSSTILPAVGGSLGVAAFVTVVGLELAGRMLGVLRRTIFEERRAVLVRRPAVYPAAGSYGRAGRDRMQPAGRFQVSSGSIPALAIGVVASLLVAVVLVPSRLPLEQPVETTGSIGAGEVIAAQASPAQAPVGDLGQPLTSPAALAGAEAGDAPAAYVWVRVSTPIAGRPTRTQNFNAQARVSSRAWSAIAPRRNALALPAAQPVPAPAKRRRRQAIPAAAPVSVPNETRPISN